ncbi:MAG: biotin--[acetyl-CoA-carboxylase] ligase [Acidimicrobiaceae bacterium]|nr:biotin--[acetyl-CoA-carboxylase] ligase [Acidimicrobiaceae bacterium]
MSISKLIDIFSAWRKGRTLQKRLKGYDYGEIAWKSSTGSTNQDLLQKSEIIAKHPAVVIADHQTAGRGRLDRKWVSDKKSALLMSVSLEADASTDMISLYSMKLSVAAVKALDYLGFPEIKIKWPNDLIVLHQGESHKLAGILAQSVIKGKIAIVVVGLGLNISLSNLRNILVNERVSALSELGKPPNVVDLAEGILKELAVGDSDGESLVAEYEKYSHTLGTFVGVDTGEEKFEGFAKRITKTGSLIIQSDNGTSREIWVGDLIHLQ